MDYIALEIVLFIVPREFQIRIEIVLPEDVPSAAEISWCLLMFMMNEEWRWFWKEIHQNFQMHRTRIHVENASLYVDFGHFLRLAEVTEYVR